MRVVWQCCRAGGGGVLAVRTARAERCEACSWRRAPREPRREHTIDTRTSMSLACRIRGRISRSRLAGTAFSTQQPVLSRRRAHTETVSFVADTRHRVTLYVYLPRDRSSPCALSPITTHTHAWNYLMNIRLCTAKCSDLSGVTSAAPFVEQLMSSLEAASSIVPTDGVCGVHPCSVRL